MISTSKIQRFKRLPYRLLAMVFIQFVMFLIICYQKVDSYADVAVRVNRLTEKTYHSVSLGVNSFKTGKDGTLQWKVNSYKEALLIEIANPDAVIRLVDVCCLLLFVIIVFVSVARINEHTDMRTRLYKFTMTLGYMVILYPVLTLINQTISEHIIEYLTQNQFTSQRFSFNYINFIVISSFLTIIGGLIKRDNDILV